MEIAPSIKGFALPHPPSNHTVETPSTNPLLQAATDDGNVILPAEFAWDVFTVGRNQIRPVTREGVSNYMQIPRLNWRERWTIFGHGSCIPFAHLSSHNQSSDPCCFLERLTGPGINLQSETADN